MEDFAWINQLSQRAWNLKSFAVKAHGLC
jgi:hypothetical protein